MKTTKLAVVLFTGLLSTELVAQKGKDLAGSITTSNTIVNAYTAVTADAAAGATSISVASSAGLSPGDLVLIIQMQGARVNAGKDSIYPDFTNSIPSNSTYGSIVDYYNSGHNEFAEVNSIPDAVSITVDCGLSNAYSTIGKVQVIKVPRYASLGITGTGSITCPAWNGTTGGVVVVEVDGATNIGTTGAFNVSAKGFRGGGRENNSTFGSGSWGSSRLAEGAYKGESIAGDTSTYKTIFAGTVSRGAVANGGGGGDGHNAGGGGGANGGNIANWNGMGIPNATYNTTWNALEPAAFLANYSGGGRGGYSYSANNKTVTTALGSSTWGGDQRRQVGGLGGRPLDYSGGRLFLGGGGGSGDENDNQGAPNGVQSGGNGGGLVYILSYGAVSGTGTIVADGGKGSNTNNSQGICSGKDGAGGGGGGGTVVINSTGTINLTAAAAISAKGGNGGNQNFGNPCTTTDAYGPGAGGGGGYVALSNGSPVIAVNGGTNGIVSGNQSTIASTGATGFPPNGATGGGTGTTSSISNFTLTASSNITICSGNTATLTANLGGTIPSPSPTINWYSTATGGSPIASGSPFVTPVLNATTTYYVGTCPGIYRIPVTVTVNSSATSPTASPVTYCMNDVAAPLSATASGGNTLNWWGTNATGGTSSATAPTPSTTAAGTTTYYVSQGSGSCESARIPIVVTVNAVPSNPTATSPVSYCQNDVAVPLSATASGSNNLNWWGTNLTGGTASATAPTPSTATTGTFSYYVSQNDGNCESARQLIQVIVNAVPAAPVVSPVSYCQNSSASPLTANGTGTLNWYDTNATGGTASATAPTPLTTTVGTTTYYVSQTVGACESPRAAIVVTINTSYSVPVTNDVTYCANDLASPLTATATGTLNWYGINATGGIASATPPTPSTTVPGTTSYYVSQGSGNCESPRAKINVIVNATPNSPAVNNNFTYCQNETAVALTATGSGTINWWGTNATGGTSSSTPPIPSTATAGTTTYYVSQTDNGCESARTPITVTVNSLPNPPTVNNVSYCQNDVPWPLSASGTTTLNWYGTNATGGTASATAPLPVTTTAGTTTYYVSQGTSTCESQRAAIVVTINAIPVISFNNNNSICAGQCVTFTDNSSTSCSNLSWDFGDGSVGSGSLPTHCYTIAGTYNVSAVCNTAAGCSGSATVSNAVVVTPIPSAVFTVSPAGPISPGTIVNFTPVAAPPTNFAWFFDDPSAGLNNTSGLSNPTHSFDNTGTYCVALTTASTTANCTSSNTICVEVVSDPVVVIPNIFTPNDDSKNDLFMINVSGIKNLSCSIFDRWGVKIYNWDGVSGYWDGKGKNGTKAPDGVYYYIVNTTDLKGDTKQNSGFVQLINN